MKSGWDLVCLEDCLQKVVLTSKINSQYYLNEGLYPVVSQELSLISGFWNTEQDVFKHEAPVIVFGDHTRVLKYIDFDFVIGADGVKILLPKKEVEAKYLYYFLLWKNIPSLGYSRHYKLLKEVKVLKPSIQIQRQIINELDTLNDIITKKKQQLEELDKLAQATFYEMFGDPELDSTPWKKVALINVCNKITDGTHLGPKFVNEGIPFLFISNIQSNEITYETNRFITEFDYLKLTKSTPIEIGDILYTSVGSYGNPAIVKSDKKFCFQRHIAHLKPNYEKLNSTFLHALLQTPFVKNQADRLAIGVAQKTLNLSAIRKIQIILPPIENQISYVELLVNIESQKSLILQSLTDTQQLFDYTMNKYFGS